MSEIKSPQESSNVIEDFKKNNPERRPLSHRIMGRLLKAAGRNPKLAKAIVYGGTAAAIGTVGVHEIGEAYDAQFKLGKYGHQKTEQEQLMDIRAGKIESDKILNGTINIRIKTDDGEELAVRSEPKVPDPEKEEDNRIAWSQIMALKTDNDSPEILIAGKNEFSISGKKIHFVNGDNPIGGEGNNGAYLEVIAIMGSGGEKKANISYSPLTRNHFTATGTFTNPDGSNPIQVN